MKPQDPDTFVEAVAAVLSLYPFDVVRECVDPRYGIARKLKWLSIAELSDWLDERLDYYRLVAATSPHEPRPALQPPPASPEMAARLQALVQKIAPRMQMRDPIARRRRVHRYLSERKLRRDRARALAELDMATAGATEGQT